MACAETLVNAGDNRLWGQNTFKRVFNLLDNPIRGIYTPDAFKAAVTEDDILSIHGLTIKNFSQRKLIF